MTPSITTLIHFRLRDRCVPGLFVSANPKEDPTILLLHGGLIVDASVPGCWHMEADCKNDSAANPAWSTADAAPKESFAVASRKARPVSIAKAPAEDVALAPARDRTSIWLAIVAIIAAGALIGTLIMGLR